MYKARWFSFRRAALTGVLFVAAGVVLVWTISAAGAPVAFEAESGTLAGGAAIADVAGQSGSGSVRFGAGPVATPTATPSLPAAFPDSTTTGSRVPDSALTPSSGVTTDHDGQVIEDLLITGGRIKIMHSNVIVRDVKIIHTSTNDGSYPIYVVACSGCAAPTNVTIEHIEIAGQPGISEGTPAVYGPAGNWTLRYANIHGMGSGPRLTYNSTVEYSYIHDMAREDTTEHKSGIGLNGGAHHVIRGNNVDCDAPGCSSALSLYGSTDRVDDVLVEGNLFNTTGSYCTYGGSVPSKAFPVGVNIRYINNTFGREYYPECGHFGYMSSWDFAGGANIWQGNVWGGGAAATSSHTTGGLINAN